MMYYLASNEVDQPDGVSETISSAALIHVSASAQQAPGMLHRCPVCGQCYGPARVVALPRQASTLFDNRLLLLCAQCGTYAVGLLTAPCEDKSPMLG